MIEPAIELEHVSVARGKQIVLHDLNLRVFPGEHLVILGPNGCGKSTLLKTLTCELYPVMHPGTRIRLFGRERWDVTQLRRRMGVVSADLPGKETLSITGHEAVLTGFFSSSTLWPHLEVTSSMRSRADEILDIVNAQPLRDTPVYAMSAGQQRRIMIGRAIAGTSGDVQMLLLDEPSNALDLAAQHDLRATLRMLAQAGTAIVLITHHTADVLPEMQRVLMIKAGRIVADGKKSDLLTEDALSSLFAREIHLTQRDGFTFAF